MQKQEQVLIHNVPHTLNPFHCKNSFYTNVLQKSKKWHFHKIQLQCDLIFFSWNEKWPLSSSLLYDLHYINFSKINETLNEGLLLVLLLVRSHFSDKSFAATIRVEVLYNSKQQQNTRSVRALRKSSELTEEGPKRRKQCGFLTDFRQNYSTVKSENIMQPTKMERFSQTSMYGFTEFFIG